MFEIISVSIFLFLGETFATVALLPPDVSASSEFYGSVVPGPDSLSSTLPLNILLATQLDKFVAVSL